MDFILSSNGSLSGLNVSVQSKRLILYFIGVPFCKIRGEMVGARVRTSEKAYTLALSQRERGKK
jgi:hypothetical protein